ncbi:MAG TPA: hypothetical protein VL977_05165, partial [Solirubrobacteraceae bacterium]|nr:hypothetical protein [Solirubrobacteraceae bacterium]
MSGSALAVVVGLAAIAGPGVPAASADSFTTSGQYSYTVPSGVSDVAITAVGGPGGACNGAAGGEAASVSGTFAVTAGEVLSVQVAGTGANCSLAGTNPGGSGGGGAGAIGGAGGG